MKRPGAAHCQWLRETHQNWKLDFSIWVAVYGYIGFVASVLVLAPVGFLVWRPAWYVAGTWLLSYFAARIVAWWILFYRIKCPKCGHNPTRRKADHAPLAEKIATARLLEMIRCPACGDAGTIERVMASNVNSAK